MQYYEEITIGASQEAGPVELTASDIVEFAERWDPWPYHTDVEVANESVFGGLAASGAHMICIAWRLLHDVDTPAVIAALGHEFEYPSPARAGDHLHIESSSIEKRESKSRTDRGIVLGLCQLINQTGTVVLEMKSTLLVAKRPT